MTPDDFKKRTKTFALRSLRLVGTLPDSAVGRVIGRQLARSATSVGANYRSACRAKSRADFIAKMRIVEEECDESLYWMELIVENGMVDATDVGELMNEGDAILSLVVASIKTARSRNQAVASNAKSPTVNLQSPIIERIDP